MAGVAYFVDPTGEVVEAPETSAEGLLRSGYQPASSQQAADFQRRDQLIKEHGGTGSAVIAGLEGAADALTFGGSTWLETGLGVDPEAIRAREKLNPVAHGIGTATGLIAPLLLSGGASAIAEGGQAARGAGFLSRAAEFTAPSLISRAGGAAAEAVLPAAEKASASLARRGLASAAQGLTEGLGFGAGEAVHRAAIDPDVTAESLAADVALSSLFGAGIGGTLGLGGGALSQIAKRSGEAGETKLGTKLSDWLKDFEAERNLKEAGAIQSDLKRVKSQIGEERLKEIALEMRDNGLLGPFSTPQRVLEKAQALQETAGVEIGDLLKAADTKVDPKTLPKIDKVLRDIRKDVLEPLQKNPLQQEAANRLGNVLDAYETKFVEDFAAKAKAAQLQGLKKDFTEPYRGRLTFRDMHQLRSQISEALYGLRGNMDPFANSYREALHSFRSAVSDELAAAMERSGQGSKAWKAANRRYEVASRAAEFAEKGLNRAQGNNFVSPTELLGTLSGAMSHGLSGGALGGLAVAGARRFGSSLLGAGARAVREGLGSATAAETVAANEAMRKATTRIGDRLGEQAQELIKRAPRAAESLAIAETPDVVRRIEQVNALANNPEALLSQIEAHIDDIQEHSPETAQALAGTLTRAVTYLQAEAPQPRIPGPLSKPQPPSRADQAIWDWKFQVATRPLEALQKGGLDADAAKTLEAVYPALYAKLQEQVLSNLMNQPDIPYQHRLRVARILRADLDGTTTPAMVQANLALSAAENTRATQAKAQQGQQRKGTLRTAKFTRASDARTPMQQTMTGNDR